MKKRMKNERLRQREERQPRNLKVFAVVRSDRKPILKRRRGHNHIRDAARFSLTAKLCLQLPGPLCNRGVNRKPVDSREQCARCLLYTSRCV